MIRANNDLGFKLLDSENWLTIDPAWDGVLFTMDGTNDPQSWVNELRRVHLANGVPEQIQTLFEAARGALIYSLMFYPLLALAMEQILRVGETGISEKCRELDAPRSSRRTFELKIGWLATQSIITDEDVPRWHAIRHLRNDASHPTRQNIYNLGIAVPTIDSVVELTNKLYA